MSWSDSRILNLYKLSRTSSGGILLIDNRISSDLVSNSWPFVLVGILEDLVQSGRNPRIQHLKIRKWVYPWIECNDLKIVHWIDHLHFFDPQHCLWGWTGTGTCWCFESYLPTWKRWRCGEFVKLKLRDRKSWLINHVILWIWSFCWKERKNSWLRVSLRISALV